MATTSDNTFAYMIETADTYLETFVTNGVAEMQGSVGLTFAVVGAVYFAIYGWMMMYGYVQASLTDTLKQMAKLAFAYIVATQGAVYALFVVDFFWALPEAIGNNLLRLTADAAGSTADTEDSIATVFETYQENLSVITEKVAKSGRIVPDILAGILAVIMQIPIIAAVFIVLIAKIGLSIMLVLGPLMIVAVLFGWTKGLFEGWLRQCLTFVMTAILAYAVIALLMSMLDTFANDLNDPAASAIKWVNAIPLALMAIICALVFLQVPQFAAGLVGGIGLRDLGATTWASRQGGRGARAAGARAGRAISRSSAPVIGAASGFATRNIVPKLPPAVQQRLSSLPAQSRNTASKVNYYTGAKNAEKPEPKGED